MKIYTKEGTWRKSQNYFVYSMPEWASLSFQGVPWSWLFSCSSDTPFRPFCQLRLLPSTRVLPSTRLPGSHHPLLLDALNPGSSPVQAALLCVYTPPFSHLQGLFPRPNPHLSLKPLPWRPHSRLASSVPGGDLWNLGPIWTLPCSDTWGMAVTSPHPTPPQVRLEMSRGAGRGACGCYWLLVFRDPAKYPTMNRAAFPRHRVIQHKMAMILRLRNTEFCLLSFFPDQLILQLSYSRQIQLKLIIVTFHPVHSCRYKPIFASPSVPKLW